MAAYGQKYPLVDTVPEDVWALREDPDRHIFDAVYVKSALRVEEERIHHYLMVRVLTEQGKAILQTLVLNEKIVHLEGRVVDIAGTETRFDKKADLMRVLAVRAGTRKQSAVVLMPPGLTPNCVVELSWSEKAEHGLPVGRNNAFYTVQEAAFCMEKTFEVYTLSLSEFKSRPISDTTVEMATRLMWSPIQPPAALESRVLGAYTVLTYRDVPAAVPQPFGNPAADTRGAVVRMFRTIQYKGMDMHTFWNNFSQVFIRHLYGDYYYKDGSYGVWLRTINKAIPSRDGDGAQQLFNAFKRKFTRADMLTPLERERLQTQDLQMSSPRSSDLLNNLAEKGYAFPPNLGLAFYRVMSDCGFKPRLIFAPEQAGPTFGPESLNAFELDLMHPAVGMQDAAGRWFLFAPAFTEFDIGQLPDAFRDKPVLVVDPADNWSSRFLTFKRPTWKHNRRLESYAVTLDADGKLAFSLSRRNQGVFNAQLRGMLHGVDTVGQGELVTAEFQERLPQWQVGGGEVEGVTDYQAKIVERVRGVCRLDLKDADWVAVDPFPGGSPPLDLPETWPAQRSQPVELPDNRGQISRCVLRLPAGMTVLGDVSVARSNKIGLVRVTLTRKQDTWIVERHIIVEESMLPPEEEPQLRAFMTWVQEAMNLRLAVGLEGV